MMVSLSWREEIIFFALISLTREEIESPQVLFLKKIKKILMP